MTQYEEAVMSAQVARVELFRMCTCSVVKDGAGICLMSNMLCIYNKFVSGDDWGQDFFQWLFTSKENELLVTCVRIVPANHYITKTVHCLKTSRTRERCTKSSSKLEYGRVDQDIASGTAAGVDIMNWRWLYRMLMRNLVVVGLVMNPKLSISGDIEKNPGPNWYDPSFMF